MAGSQLRLVVAENRGVALDVADPGVLRVEIGAARAAARADERGASIPRGDGQPASR